MHQGGNLKGNTYNQAAVMDKYVSHWLERSRYDLDTAKAMLDAGRYLYVAYMCQQAVEKLLKGIIAQLGKENLPIHNLSRLAEQAELRAGLIDEQMDLLAELTAYNIEARYGDYKDSLAEV
ncbi:MAG TPA: HEPN domain-containing protein [Desulfobacterales bacterium]|nr:HEPN domain-containing protein [Desulfobacterales bacterium]